MRRLTKPLIAVAMMSVITSAVGSETRNDNTLKRIVNYRQWNRITAQPLAVEFASIGG